MTAHRFALVVCVFFICALSACRKVESFIDESRRFEAFQGATEQFSLAATPREIQRLVVNFYAPDCPPCEKEIPAIKKFYEKYRNNKAIGFFAIGSSLKAIEQNPKPGKDPPVSREQIHSELKQFSQKYASDWPQYLADGEDLRAWRITGFPETFLFVRVNDRWQLSRKIISEISFETLESFAAGGAAQENSVGSYR